MGAVEVTLLSFIAFNSFVGVAGFLSFRRRRQSLGQIAPS